MISEVDFSDLEHSEFRPLWQTLLALGPGLHPDEIGHKDGGWENDLVIRAIGEEADRRHETGSFSNEEFYDYRAQQSGLTPRDQFPEYTIDEEYFSCLPDSTLKQLYKLVVSLPLDLNSEEIDLESGWGDHYVTECLGREILNRFSGAPEFQNT